MNPTRIHAVNFRSFHELELDLPVGCVSVSGANGAGKSSILAAIDVALFGPVEGRSLAPYLHDDATGPLTLELDIDAQGRRFRVRRGYADGKSATLELDELTDEGAVPLTAENTAATQAVLERELGVTRTTLVASSLLRQGERESFVDVAPAARKAILASALDLDVWERRHELVKRELARLEGEYAQTSARAEQVRDNAPPAKTWIEQQIKLVEADVETARLARDTAVDSQRDLATKITQEEHATEALENARRAVKYRQGHVDRLLEAVSERLELVKRVTELRRELEPADATRERASELGDEVAKATDALAGVEAAQREHDAQLRELAQLREATDELVARKRDRTERAAGLIGRLGEPLETCHTCGQELATTAAAAAARGALEQELSATRASEADLVDQIVALRERVGAIIGVETRERPDAGAAAARANDAARAYQEAVAHRDALTRRAGELEAIESRIANGHTIDTLKAEAEAAAVELADANARVAADEASVTGDLGAMRASLELLSAELTDANVTLERALERRAALVGELERRAQTDQTLSELGKALSAVTLKISVESTLEQAYGRNGIPALILENRAIPRLESEANLILAELGTTFTVELRTQRAKKTGGVSETLDIVVSDGTAERPFSTYSGGERTRLALALRLALAALLADRAGGSRFLAIDEPEYLDDDGTERLVNVLRRLESNFDRVYLVSHVPDLRDAFDTTLAVERTNGSSRVIEGTTAAAENVSA